MKYFMSCACTEVYILCHLLSAMADRTILRSGPLTECKLLGSVLLLVFSIHFGLFHRCIGGCFFLVQYNNYFAAQRSTVSCQVQGLHFFHAHCHPCKEDTFLLINCLIFPNLYLQVKNLIIKGNLTIWPTCIKPFCYLYQVNSTFLQDPGRIF